MAKSKAGKYLQTIGGGSVTDQIRAGNIPGHTGVPEHRADEPGIIWIDINRIHPSPYQHEEYIDPNEFQSLVQSMEESPYPFALNVNIMDNSEDVFLTAGGHQRVKAAKQAGRAKMAVFIEPPLSRFQLAMRAVRENAVQVNRSRINMGFLFKQMLEEFKESEGLTQEKIAEALGDNKGRSYVEYSILAADSLPIIQSLINERPDSVKAMLYLRRIKPQIKDSNRTEPTQEEIAEANELLRPIIEKYKNAEFTAKDVELEVRRVLQQGERAEVITPESRNTINQETLPRYETDFAVSDKPETNVQATEDELLNTSTNNLSKQHQEQSKSSTHPMPKPVENSQTIKRVGRAENARGTLLSYKKIAPTHADDLTSGELALLDEIVCIALSVLDMELMQYLEGLASVDENIQRSLADGEKPLLVNMLHTLLLSASSRINPTNQPHTSS